MYHDQYQNRTAPAMPKFWRCESCSRLIGNEHSIRCCDCGNWFHRICAKMTVKEIKNWSNSKWHCGCDNPVDATTSEGHDAIGNQPDVERCGEDIVDSRCQLLVNPSGGESGRSGLSEAMAEMQISDEPRNMYDQHDHFAMIATSTQNLAADTCEELPSFVENSAAIEGQWCKISTSTFASKLNEYYDIAIHWKRNAFVIPYGNAVKVLIEELTKLDMFKEKNSMQGFSVKVFQLLIAFVLQKPSKDSKAKDHSK